MALGVRCFGPSSHFRSTSPLLLPSIRSISICWKIKIILTAPCRDGVGGGDNNDDDEEGNNGRDNYDEHDDIGGDDDDRSVFF